MVTFNLQAKPLPSNFKGTPQQLLEAILERLEILGDTATFVMSDTQPTTDVGPWFKNGTQLWVWTGATYEPLDVSPSVTPQIWISDTAPDPLEYQYWFSVSGVTVTGFFYYLDGAWVKQSFAVEPGSITSAKLADGAATTEKFADASVTIEKLLSPIMLAKWAIGAANYFLRMRSDATAAEYSLLRVESSETVAALSTTITFPHGLTEIPHHVQAVIIPQVDIMFSGSPVIPAGTEVDYTSWVGALLTKSNTSAQLIIPSTFSLAYAYVRMPQTASQWKVKFYVTPA